MGIFSRRRPEADTVARQAAAVADFWSWWQGTGSAEADAAIASGAPEQVVAELSRRVEEIHPELSWELAPGTSAEHALVVTAAGDPHLRATARRWRLAAPAADATWEYSDVRLPVSDPDGLVVTFDGDVAIDLASASASARVAGTRLDVAVHHPRFADLPEESRLRSVLVLLDKLLGEEAVELWIGEISTTTYPPLDPVPLTGLGSVISQLRERFTGPDGAAVWIGMEGTADDGRPVLAAAQVPLSPALTPELDTHVALVVPYPVDEGTGLPDPETNLALRAFGEHVTERLGRSGRIVARETHGGRRILHAYVDGATPAVEQVRAAVQGWEHGRVELHDAHDPAWERVAHLRA